MRKIHYEIFEVSGVRSIKNCGGNQNFKICLNHTFVNRLSDKNFCNQEADKIHLWMLNNLPSGIYRELSKIISEHRKNLEAIFEEVHQDAEIIGS